MITFRTEISLMKDVTLHDVWKGFCKWRAEAKHSTQIEKQWFSKKMNTLKTRAVVLKSTEECSILRTFYNKRKQLLAIQYIQDEKKKIFTTIIIVNTNLKVPVLSYTMEETPFEEDEFTSKKTFLKPRFFAVIDSLVDKKYVPCDLRGDPLSFTPNIFVSDNIPVECHSYLREKYRHTANIRISTKKSAPKKEQEKTNLNESECDISKTSTYFITGTKNLNLVEEKTTWNFILQNQSSWEKKKLEKIKEVKGKIWSHKKSAVKGKSQPSGTQRRKVVVVKKKIGNFEKTAQD